MLVLTVQIGEIKWLIVTLVLLLIGGSFYELAERWDLPKLKYLLNFFVYLFFIAMLIWSKLAANAKELSSKNYWLITFLLVYLLISYILSIHQEYFKEKFGRFYRLARYLLDLGYTFIFSLLILSLFSYSTASWIAVAIISVIVFVGDFILLNRN